MPKLKPSQMEETRRKIMAPIVGGMTRYGLTPEDMAALCGVSLPTWYSRIKKPEEFSAGELIRIFKRLKIKFKFESEEIEIV